MAIDHFPDYVLQQLQAISEADMAAFFANPGGSWGGLHEEIGDEEDDDETDEGLAGTTAADPDITPPTEFSVV
jgi:hypothetical protein